MPNQDQSPAAASPTMAYPYPATILVVEDDATLSKAICGLLRDQGYFVIVARDGQDALNLLHQCHVDMILSDVVMPRLDGYGLLHAIRTDERLFHLPVVFLTGYATPQDRRRAKECGVEDYLVKPLDSHDLLATVRNVLVRRGMVEEAVQRQVDAVRDQIIALVQHEFRTPLTFVMGYAELLQDELGQKMLRADLQHSIDAILEGSRRLHHLIESFLTLASLSETALHSGELYPLEPMALWRDSVNVLRPNLDQTDLQVVYEDPPHPVVAYGKYDLLREALVRLLDNAIVYARPTSRTIRLASAARPSHVGWIIQDEGMGIPENRIEQIIQPFTRVPVNPGAPHGIGLGLTLVQRVAQLHNGFLRVESKEGVGSTFELWIPNVEPEL